MELKGKTNLQSAVSEHTVNGRSKSRQIIFWVLSHVLALFWMYVIFGFSAQNGESSGGLSEKVCLTTVGLVNDVCNMGWTEPEVVRIAKPMEYPVRKLAHMTEFGILAMLYYWVLGFYPKIQQVWKRLKNGQSRYVLAFAMTVAYAAADEFHQLFIPDRSGNLFDVCVDSTGALLALFFLWIIMKILKRKR